MESSPAIGANSPSRALGSGAKALGWRRGSALALLLVLWARFLYTLVFDWEVDPQYAHGWFIPVLAAILIAVRWRTTPAAEPSRQTGAPLAALAAGLLALAPLAFMQAVYPEARPFQWLHGLLVAGATFAVLQLYGGFPWVKHFAFPVFFLLLSVPWPRAFQNRVTNTLMEGVASTTVELTLLAGIPALQHGNTIGLNESVVGIDEACSGVRSLQGSMIIGLFLGSYFPMLPWARAALVLGALVGSLLLNVVRATVLTWISATRGAHALEYYHDPAGMAILVGVFIATVWLARVLERKWPQPSVPTPPRPDLGPGSPALGYACVAGLAWLGMTELSRHVYFGPLPHADLSRQWQLDFTRAPGDVRNGPINPAARQFLRYDTGQSKIIERGDGLVARVIELQWQGGEVSAAGARLHGPSVCLPSLGYELKETLPPVTLHIHGVAAVFNAMVFTFGDRPAYVYHALWEDNRAVLPGDYSGDQSLHSAVRAVLEKRRLSNARVLLLMVTGAEDAAEATGEMEKLLERVLINPSAAS